MCIAIYQPIGLCITDDHLLNCWNNNNDGAGMMYVDDESKIVIFKELEKFKKFKKAFHKAVEDFPNSPFVLHFRIKTSGKVDRKNCHPMRVNRNLAFCHNGIINYVDVPTNSPISDTNIFNDEVLKGLPSDWLENDVIRTMVGKIIKTSKLVFLDSSKKVAIINEKDGTWDEGLWFSNYTFRVKKVKKYNNNYTPCYPYNQQHIGTRSRYTVKMCKLFSCYKTLYTDVEQYTGICNDCLRAYIADDYYVKLYSNYMLRS